MPSYLHLFIYDASWYYHCYHQYYLPFVSQSLSLITIVIRQSCLIISIIIGSLLPVYFDLSGHHACSSKILLFLWWKNGGDLIVSPALYHCLRHGLRCIYLSSSLVPVAQLSSCHWVTVISWENPLQSRSLNHPSCYILHCILSSWWPHQKMHLNSIVAQAGVISTRLPITIIISPKIIHS